MGNLCRSPVIHMPLQYVTRRLENCMFPEDKAIAMQMLDEIDIQLADIKTAEMKMVQLKNLDGMRIIRSFSCMIADHVHDTSTGYDVQVL